MARLGEPLEPLLHALRIGARVGWDETLDEILQDRRVAREQMLFLAGQVFEYIDQLSSRVAYAYTQKVEEMVRAQALTESALFEEIVSGRAGPDRVEALSIPRPRVALAVAAAVPDRRAAERAIEVVTARLRLRFPRSVVGQRGGLSIWLLAREPLPQVLHECSGTERVCFGISSATEALPLGRAVEEAVVAARLGLELGTGSAAPIEYPHVYPYAALRLDPVSLARCQAALLGPILDRPPMLATLRQYFASGRSISATAKHIHLHRQSVIYRLRRISELLELDFSDAEHLWRVECAMRALPTPHPID
jgi:DNA-binding PucR family transcriptional regulator